MNICDLSAIEASIMAIANEIEYTSQDEKHAAEGSAMNAKQIVQEEEEQKPFE